MRIFLVRHGESIGNVDKAHYKTTPDFAIPLSEQGRGQARAAADALDKHLFPQGFVGPTHPRFRVWTSPYTRTRQTADEFLDRFPPMCIIDRREHVLLAEQQFGLLDGIAGEAVEDHYPDVAQRYDLYKGHGGKFWTRPPAGESRFDVCQRVHQAFGTFQRDADKHGIQDLIVIAHGTTLRAFVMMWLHLPYEWFEREPNPKNCSIRLIEGSEDRGYVYEGG